MEYELLMCAETKEMHRQILEGFAQNLPTTNKTVDRTVRYCDKCRLIKPDRTHHCSVCGECVLKMDHHCPWINNCVNFTNYKCFILFLGYALLYCIYVSLTSLQYFIAFWKVNYFTEIDKKGHVCFFFRVICLEWAGSTSYFYFLWLLCSLLV